MTISSLQPDLAHRYRLIGAILAELRPASPDGRLRLLDLGAGPESLVEAVMPPWCELHRADVDTFGRDDITTPAAGRAAAVRRRGVRRRAGARGARARAAAGPPAVPRRMPARVVAHGNPFDAARHQHDASPRGCLPPGCRAHQWQDHSVSRGARRVRVARPGADGIGAGTPRRPGRDAGQRAGCRVVAREPRRLPLCRSLRRGRARNRHRTLRRIACCRPRASGPRTIVESIAPLATPPIWWRCAPCRNGRRPRRPRSRPRRSPSLPSSASRPWCVISRSATRSNSRSRTPGSRSSSSTWPASTRRWPGFAVGSRSSSSTSAELEASLGRQTEATTAAEAEGRRAVADGEERRVFAPKPIEAERDQRAAAEAERLRLQLLTLEERRSRRATSARPSRAATRAHQPAAAAHGPGTHGGAPIDHVARDGATEARRFLRAHDEHAGRGAVATLPAAGQARLGVADRTCPVAS